MPHLTVMIPCLNEATTLPIVLRQIHEALENCEGETEVLVVDNNSTDGSAAIAREHGARVVHEARRGYGSAIQRGLTEARGDFIIYADADASYDFRYIPAFLARLEEGSDLVVGSRFHGRMHPKAMPWLHRYVGTPFLTGTINLLYGTKYWDCNGGMRGVRRAVVPTLDLQATGMEIASEMLVRAKQRNLRFSQLPMDFFPDRRGHPSHLRTLRDGLRHLRLIVSYRLRP